MHERNDRNAKTRAYEKWIDIVNGVLSRYMLCADEMDYSFEDDFDNGMSPRESARNALQQLEKAMLG